MATYYYNFLLPVPSNRSNYGSNVFPNSKYFECWNGNVSRDEATTLYDDSQASYYVMYQGGTSDKEYYFNVGIKPDYQDKYSFNEDSIIELFFFNSSGGIRNASLYHITDFNGSETGLMFERISDYVIQLHFMISSGSSSSMSGVYLGFPQPEYYGYNNMDTSTIAMSAVFQNLALWYGEYAGETDTKFTRVENDNSIIFGNIVDSGTEIPEPDEPEPEEPQPVVDYANIILDISHADVDFYIDDIWTDSTDIPIDSTVVIDVKANDGYYFQTTPYVVYYGKPYGDGRTLDFDISDINPDNEYPTIFTLTFDCSTAYLTGTNSLGVHANATIKQTKDPETGFTGDLGIVTYYTPSKENLRTIASNREYLMERDSYFQVLDKGDYIASLRQVFMNVETSDDETLMLGGFNMGFKCPTVATVLQTVEVGTFNINELFGNIYDYTNTEIKMYLPFYGFYTFDTYDLMNKRIHVYYKVHVPTGDSVIFIDTYDDDLDTFITTVTLECNISYDIPYLVDNSKYNSTAIFNNNKILYGFKPFIVILRNRAQNTLEVKSSNKEYKQLKELNGLVVCDTTFNKVNCTDNERTLIDNICRSGILI